jgi:hypothetical protein
VERKGCVWTCRQMGSKESTYIHLYPSLWTRHDASCVFSSSLSVLSPRERFTKRTGVRCRKGSSMMCGRFTVGIGRSCPRERAWCSFSSGRRKQGSDREAWKQISPCLAGGIARFRPLLFHTISLSLIPRNNTSRSRFSKGQRFKLTWVGRHKVEAEGMSE